MHSVKKTKPTPASVLHAKQEEQKRENKKKLFIETKERVFEKRDKGEYDEEMLTLTGEILEKHSDIYTLWKIRRETVSRFAKSSNEEALAKLYEEELALTWKALLSNPKSYSAWHHRFWAFSNHPAANLREELKLCEKALAVDCRNFHCWDHRRSVAKLAQLSADEELAFSDALIGQNPSNYSAWHYRATLLPKLKPGLNGMQISEECFEEELKKITDICCVNSQDQTAWTYCRWLLDVASEAPMAASSERVKRTVREFVKMCQELLKEEDDNPSIHLALALGEIQLHESSAELLQARFKRIAELDPQRKNMYADMCSAYLTKVQ